MSYHSALGALSCPEQCEGGCTEKFGASGYPHDECVKACLSICTTGGVPPPGGGGGEEKGAFLGAAVIFAGAALAIGAVVYFGRKH
jgi:hypothetical protein